MKTLILISFLFLLVSCNEQKQTLPESKTIAIVGEQQVSADMLQAFLADKGVTNADKNISKKAYDALITEVAMANIAKKKKMSLTTEQLNRLEYLKTQFYAKLAKQDYLDKNPITDEEIQKEYTSANKQAGNKQYHVHHLLYQDEVQAIKQFEEIKTVADYLAVEKAFKQNNPNIRGVGDLGWVTLGQLPKDFAKVLPTTKMGTLVASVVNSSAGAHIIYLQETRNFKPPDLEQVKTGIISTLKSKKASKFAQLARAKAHIKTQ